MFKTKIVKLRRRLKVAIGKCSLFLSNSVEYTLMFLGVAVVMSTHTVNFYIGFIDDIREEVKTRKGRTKWAYKSIVILLLIAAIIW